MSRGWRRNVYKGGDGFENSRKRGCGDDSGCHNLTGEFNKAYRSSSLPGAKCQYVWAAEWYTSGVLRKIEESPRGENRVGPFYHASRSSALVSSRRIADQSHETLFFFGNHGEIGLTTSLETFRDEFPPVSNHHRSLSNDFGNVWSPITSYAAKKDGVIKTRTWNVALGSSRGEFREIEEVRFTQFSTRGLRFLTLAWKYREERLYFCQCRVLIGRGLIQGRLC